MIHSILGCIDSGGAPLSTLHYRQALVAGALQLRHQVYPDVKTNLQGAYGIAEPGVHMGPYSFASFLEHFLQVRVDLVAVALRLVLGRSCLRVKFRVDFVCIHHVLVLQ